MRIFSYEYRHYYTINTLLPQLTLSPRKLLYYNNVLLLLCSLALMAFSIYLCVVFSDSNIADGNPNVGKQTDGNWLNWLFLVIQGFFLCVISIIGMRGGHLVDVSLLLAYFWLLVVFVAPVVLTTVACTTRVLSSILLITNYYIYYIGFDFYQYLNIWFEHNWETSSFYGIRDIFCHDGTAQTLCNAPLGGGSFGSIAGWCEHTYNTTSCVDIRSDAIESAIELGRNFTLAQGIIGILNMVEIGISMYLCTHILTHSVITESMNDIMNFLLVLPIAGCIGIGAFIYPLKDLAYFTWFPYYFIGLAAMQVFALPIGVIAGRLKSQNLLLFYIFLATIVTGGLAGAGVTAFIFAGIVTDNLKPTVDEKNNLACSQQFTGCCCCNNIGLNNTHTTDLCPQWSTAEVVSLLQLDLKIVGVVALVSMAYLVGSLTVSGLLNTDLKNYKTDYV